MQNEYTYQEDLVGFNHFIAKTLSKMALGLLVTTIVAVVVLFSGAWMWFFESRFNYLLLIIAELGVVFYLSSRINTMDPNKALMFFLIYSALSGVTFSVLPIIFNVYMMFMAFGLTTLMFGSMAIIGYRTSFDLTKYANYFKIALVMLLVISFIGFFFAIETFQIIVAYFGVILFLGLTAYDIQKMRQYYDYYQGDEVMLSKICTISALSLYLDFVNIFIYVLRIFGNKRK